MTNFCPRAIIFDMDGLLVDSEPVWKIAEDGLIVAHGAQPSLEVRERIIGMRLDEMFVEFRRAYDLKPSIPELTQELIERMCALIPLHVTPKTGVHELLAFVQEKHIPIALASSSPMAIIDAIMDAMDWRALFTLRVSGDEVNRGKPAPDIYAETARRMGVDPSECLALEDSPNGSRAAVGARMICYAVPDLSHSQPSAFAAITPHVYTDLHAVLADLRTCAFA